MYPMNIKKLDMGNIKDQVEMIYTEMVFNRYVPDNILGIQLGGLIPALMLAKRFCYPHIGTIEMGDMGRPIYKKIQNAGDRILIIDDIADSGETFENVVSEFKTHYPTKEIKTASLVYKVHTSQFEPDFIGMRTDTNSWIQYPWEWNDEV